MTPEKFERLMKKAHSQIIELLRQNLTLRTIIKNAWPEDGIEKIGSAMNDQAIQQVVTTHLAGVLEDHRRLADLIDAVRSSPEVEIALEKFTTKPH